MSNLVKVLLAALIFWVWMVFARSYYICEVKALCGPKLPELDSLELEKLPRTLKIVIDEIPVLEDFPEFAFDYSSTSSFYSSEHKRLLEKLANMLKSQPKSRLLITGYYLQIEKFKNPDRYNNLGLARAMTIADKLLHEYKIAPEQLMTAGEMLNDSILKRPIVLDLLGYIPVGEELQAREEELFKKQWADSLNFVTYNGLLAFFEPGMPEIKAVPAFEEYADSLKNYLADNPKARLLLTGYSDTHQSASEAERSGMQYAKLTQNYLKKVGIKNIMELKSKGKNEPLVSDVLPDKTPELLSVAKNRRVDILIKLPGKK